MKKGFTLIELLAVIVILSVITLITVPMITNVIEESKKKALASSVEGLVESANLYAIEKDGVYEFLFDEEHKGSTKKGESLDYRGTIDGEGKLYLDREGNVSVCISNDKYYAYKNYNSGIIVGERSKDNCNIEYDALTNKYVAFLESKGSGSNVYSKDEVDNLVDSLDTKITNNTNKITSMKSNIEELQNNLNNLSSLVGSNTESINHLNNKLNSVFININNKIKTVSLPSSVNPASYIAEEDCYIVAKIHGNNYQSGYLAIDGVRLYEWNNQSSTTMFFNTTQLVKKGQTVTIRNYGATGSYDVYGVQN